MGGRTKSAARGYDIPKGLNPMVQTHEEEMILPSEHANTMRRLAEMERSGALGGGGATSPAFAPVLHVHAADSRDMVRAMRQGGALDKALRGMRRDFVKV